MPPSPNLAANKPKLWDKAWSIGGWKMALGRWAD